MEDSTVCLSKCLMSPSCCITRHEEYTRLPPLPPSCGRERAGSGSGSGSGSSSSRNGSNRSRRLWRRLLWRLVRESNKCINGCSSNNKMRPPPLTFQYDAVSYSQNFDEGCHAEDCQYIQRFSPVIIR